MTIGKDVSSVFAEVTSCSQTADLEVKKLVYLYLINYAKSQPELAILAVNTFVKVCSFEELIWLAVHCQTCFCTATGCPAAGFKRHQSYAPCVGDSHNGLHSS